VITRATVDRDMISTLVNTNQVLRKELSDRGGDLSFPQEKNTKLMTQIKHLNRDNAVFKRPIVEMQSSLKKRKDSIGMKEMCAKSYTSAYTVSLGECITAIIRPIFSYLCYIL
jgi:hypothetical protein